MVKCIVIFDGISVILFILSGMVEVHKESKIFLANVKKLEFRNMARFNRTWARKFWRSCCGIRIKFGETKLSGRIDSANMS